MPPPPAPPPVSPPPPNPPPPSSASWSVTYSGARRGVVLLGLVGVLVVAFGASLALGSRWLGPGALWHALAANDGSDPDVIVRSLRFPRTVVAALIGLCLGIA